MKSKLWQHKSIRESFFAACEGLGIVIRTEHNAKRIVCFAVLALATGVALHISVVEMMILVLVVAAVFLCEVFNTVVESILDLIQPETDPHIRILKDVSSAAVLLASIAAAVVGCLMFLPRLMHLWQL